MGVDFFRGTDLDSSLTLASEGNFFPGHSNYLLCQDRFEVLPQGRLCDFFSYYFEIAFFECLMLFCIGPHLTSNVNSLVSYQLIFVDGAVPCTCSMVVLRVSTVFQFASND